MVMMIKWLLGLGLLFGFTNIALASHFRGGYISWAPDPDEPNKIVVTWRLSWRRSTSNCDERVLIGDTDNINCNACTPSSTSARVLCTDTNQGEDWSSGVNTAVFTVNGPSTAISYSSGGWISGMVNGGGNWNLVSHVDLTRRLDNNRINSSPKTEQSPMVYIQQGCQLTINIPVVDVDDDVVRCRWADSDESGGLTRPDSNTLRNLDEANCRLTVFHNTETLIAIALSIEDFLPPYTSSSRRLSSVPLQFLVKVTNQNPPLPCNLYNQKPVFVSPTPENDDVFDVLAGTTSNMTLRARAVDSTLPIIEFSSVSPPGLSKSNLQDGDNEEKYINVQYTPTTNQNDTHLFCFSAEDSRQTSEQRCIRFRVIADVTPPVISVVPSNQTILADNNSSTSAAYWIPPAANDNTGKAVTVTSNYDPGHRFSIGKTVVTYQAVDTNGNTASSSFDIYVVDVEPPHIFGAPYSVHTNTDNNSAMATVVWTPPTASDNSGESITLLSDYKSGDAFSIGSTNNTYTAMDSHGNTATISFQVVVTDVEPPHIFGVPYSVNTNTDNNSAMATVVWTTPTASDNSGESITLLSDYKSGDTFPIGYTNVTYTAMDSHENTATISFQVVVTDKEKPSIIDGPSSVIASTDANSSTAIVFWRRPTISDNSGEPVTLTSDHVPGKAFPIGTTRVRYTAIDAYGNMASHFFVVVVTDMEQPVIHGLSTLKTVNADTHLATATVSWTPPTARDNSGMPVTVTSNYQSGQSFALGNTTVEYRAVDAYGNIGRASFAIEVLDTEAPRLLSRCPDFIEVFTNTLSNTVTWSTPNFTDNSGEFNLSSSLSSPSILNVGSHSVVHVAMDKSGNSAHCIVIIHVTAICNGSRELLVSRNFTWPVSKAGDTNIESLEICGNHTKRNGTGIAVRVCRFDKAYGGSRWLDAKYVGCGEEGDYSTSLTDLSQTAVNDDNVLIVAQAVVNATAKLLQNTTDNNIGEVADTLSNIVEAGSDDPQVTVSVVNIVNNVVLAADDDESSENGISQKETNADELLGILVDFEQQIERAAKSGQDIPPVVENNIIFTTTTVSPEISSDVSFAITSDNSADDDEFGDVDVEKGAMDAETEVRTSISLPASIFQESNTSLGVSFVVHRTDTLFPSNSTNETRIIGGDIISAIVTGASGLDNLSNPVVLQFSAHGANPSCVFWDFVDKDWSEAGCHVNEYSKSHVTCHCYHLTNFAVLLDSNQEDSHIILDVISKVGCALSVCALLLMIGIYTGFRRLRRGRGPKRTARKILLQFSVALCLLYTVFLVGIDQTQNPGWCVFVAVLLQYLTLVTLMCMAVEAQNMYADLVRIFDPKSDQFFLRSAIVAWGAPLIVTAISLTAGLSSYQHGNYCFVASYPLHYGVILPVAMILLHNLVIFGMVIRVLLKVKEGKAFTTSKRLKNALTISILMGITWLFGFFSIEDAEFVFSLIFCLLNSFQGVVIFWLFCLRQEDVLSVLRPYYMHIWCVRVCVFKERHSNQHDLHHSIKTPYSQDQFTFELANSTFDFDSTTQTNPVTIMSEVEPEITIEKAEKETKLKSIPATESLVDNREFRDDSKQNNVNSDSYLKRNDDSIAVDAVLKPRELDNLSLNSDDAEVPLDHDKDTDVKNGIPQTDDIQTGNESMPTRIYEQIKVKAHNNLKVDPKTQQGQAEHKRRIFSIYDIYVTDTREEKNDRNQIQNGGATILDSLDDEFKETKIVDGGNEEGNQECLTDDEDMLVAPIEIENDIRDAKIDVDKD